MSLTQNRWFRRLGFGALAAVALGTAAMTTVPAQAREFGYYHPAPVVQHAAFFPRFFFGVGGHHWDHHDRWDHHWR